MRLLTMPLLKQHIFSKVVGYHTVLLSQLAALAEHEKMKRLAHILTYEKLFVLLLPTTPTEDLNISRKDPRAGGSFT